MVGFEERAEDGEDQYRKDGNDDAASGQLSAFAWSFVLRGEREEGREGGGGGRSREEMMVEDGRRALERDDKA